jgi:hypothetical protein
VSLLGGENVVEKNSSASYETASLKISKSDQRSVEKPSARIKVTPPKGK